MGKQEIISELKKSKKYKNISSDVLNNEFEKFQKRNQNWSDFKEKHILKELKRQLHKLHGSFHFLENKDSKRREELIEKLKNNLSSQEIIEEILKTNKSTKERLEKYKEVYREIFKITGKPTSIIDFGCGLNPLSFIFMNLNNVAYNAYEINKEDVKIVNEYFNINAVKQRVNGRAELLDCSKIENLKKLHSCDLCFMFKFLDPIEKSHGKGHKLAEQIIQTLREKCKFIVVSFATRTISGKNMNFAYRGWIERMLSRIGLDFKMIDFSNSIGEVFYVVES